MNNVGRPSGRRVGLFLHEGTTSTLVDRLAAHNRLRQWQSYTVKLYILNKQDVHEL